MVLSEKESIEKNVIGGRFALVAGGKWTNDDGEKIPYKASVQLSGGKYDAKRGIYKVLPSYMLEIIKMCESDKSFRKELEELAKTA